MSCWDIGLLRLQHMHLFNKIVRICVYYNLAVHGELRVGICRLQWVYPTCENWEQTFYWTYRQIYISLCEEKTDVSNQVRVSCPPSPRSIDTQPLMRLYNKKQSETITDHTRTCNISAANQMCSSILRLYHVESVLGSPCRLLLWPSNNHGLTRRNTKVLLCEVFNQCFKSYKILLIQSIYGFPFIPMLA